MLLYLLLLFIGTALGSFSLVLAWRMHSGTDWVRGRSACDSCKHELGVTDLIPVVSYAVLRGACRYCKKPIPKTVLLAETGFGIVAVLSFVFWPYALFGFGFVLFGMWITILVLLSALFWYDMRWFLLPNKLVYPLIVLSALFVLGVWLVQNSSVTSGLLVPVGSAVFLSGLFFVLYAVSRGKWIGFGDVRLAVALGLILGSPLLSWIMLFIASCLGILVALPKLVNKKIKFQTQIPFGPLLISATIIVFLFGRNIIRSYTNFIGL